MARLMLSAGMFTDLALSTAVRSRGLEAGSPPPMRAAIDISRMILVKIFPRLASSAPFLCLIECHLECPDIEVSCAKAYVRSALRKRPSLPQQKSPAGCAVGASRGSGIGRPDHNEKNPGNVLL